MDLIGKKHATHLVHLYDHQCTTKKDAVRNIRSTVQLKLHEMQDSWLSGWDDEIQGYADKNVMKNFYSSLKEVYGLTSARSSLFWVQMEPSSYQRRTRVGLSISMVY